MNALTQIDSDGLSRLVEALRKGMEVAPSSAFLRLREKCELRIVAAGTRTPPLWQLCTGRVDSERDLLRRLICEPGQGLPMVITDEGSVIFEGTLQVRDGESVAVVFELPRMFPEHAPKVYVKKGSERVELRLELQRVWSQDKDCGFAVKATLELLRDREPGSIGSS